MEYLLLEDSPVRPESTFDLLHQSLRSWAVETLPGGEVSGEELGGGETGWGLLELLPPPPAPPPPPAAPPPPT